MGLIDTLVRKEDGLGVISEIREFFDTLENRDDGAGGRDDGFSSGRRTFMA